MCNGADIKKNVVLKNVSRLNSTYTILAYEKNICVMRGGSMTPEKCGKF